jgi:lipopolysaccharide export system protein LptA
MSARKSWPLFVAALLTCAPLAAHAEKADRDKPVNLEADRVTIDDAKQVATFEGNVVLTQGTLQIRGDKMVVRQDAEGFQYAVVTGNLAVFRQKREGYDEYIEGFAERVEYDAKAERAQMFNRAVLKRGLDEARGNYISYDASTEFFRVTGGGKQAATANNPDGRVRIVMQPKPKVTPPPGGPVTLQPLPDLAAPRDDAKPAPR